MGIATEVRVQYAPAGELRVALNHGNRVLVGRDASGRPEGISVDLAQMLAAEVDLPLRFIEFDRAIDVFSSAQDDVWDVCFLAVDPRRAETIDFTDPYVRIEGSYLGAAACSSATSDELVASGARVGSIVGTAYTLTLERLPGYENVVLYKDILALLAALDAGEVEAIAGIGAVMAREAESRPGARVLAPPFMEIRQAMAVPRGRPMAGAHLRQFISDAARRGRIGDILERQGVGRGSAIVPE